MLVVAKLHPISLEIEKTWNVSVSRLEYANGFITQGILYLLDSGTAKNSQISFAYDLYSDSRVPLSPLAFTNIFNKNKMLAYDYHDKWIIAWDGGRLVSYPFNVLQRV